jgi:PfaD family protein
MVQELLADGLITSVQAEMALTVPMSDAITIEADSGGHTDSRPLSVLLPFFVRMRNQVQRTIGYRNTVMIGAAGGIGDPQAINGALSMGADYVLLGSVHQCTLEAGTSDLVKQMLSEMTIIDCALGIAPDMFEIGAHVQVLKKGTMYAQRSQKLYSLYQRYDSIDALPKTERTRLEKQVFKQSLEEVWNKAAVYWRRNPSQIERAQRDPKHKMALIFRWYLGNSSRWARMGDRSRKMDFQIWCGPSLGCLNQWVKGTDLESWSNRRVVDVVHHLLDGVIAARR